MTETTLPIDATFAVEFETDPTIPGSVAGIRKDLVAGGRVPPVAIETIVAGDRCEAYVAILPELLDRARIAAAETLLERSAFASHPAYLDAIRTLSERLKPAGAALAGESGLKRFEVDATYYDGSGEFGDSAEAHSAAEAEFQIRWTMTENMGYRAWEDPHRFARVMDSHRIHNVAMEAMSRETLKGLFADLIREAEASGHTGPALEAAKIAAENLGLDVSPAPGPTI